MGNWLRSFGLAAAADACAVGRQCEICRLWSAHSLCKLCLSRFAPARARCGRCAMPVPAHHQHTPESPATPLRCYRCLTATDPTDNPGAMLGTHWSWACCAVDYAYPWDRLIARLKFGGDAQLAWPLSDLLVQALVTQNADARALQRITPARQVDGIVAVPLSRARLALRGYNQSWELARAVARRLGRTAHARVLQRHGSLTPQAQAQRHERLQRMQGVFSVPSNQTALVRGQRLALLDDVMTTGATLHAAAAALREAGAAEVQVWAVARTA